MKTYSTFILMLNLLLVFSVVLFNDVLTPYYLHIALSVAQGEYTKRHRETGN